MSSSLAARSVDLLIFRYPWVTMSFAAEGGGMLSFVASNVPLLLVLIIGIYGVSRLFASCQRASRLDILAALGPVLTASGAPGDTTPTADALAGCEYVLLYASASWCPPCRAFTPRLGEWAAAHCARLKTRLIFVSLDRDDASFREYLGHMSWRLAVPLVHATAHTVPALQIISIPTLILLDGRTGAVLSRSCVEEVSADPNGTKFPWLAPELLIAARAAAAKEMPTARADTALAAPECVDGVCRLPARASVSAAAESPRAELSGAMAAAAGGKVD